MASSSRRNIASFSLSFLDIMFCGFGAVVLLVLIINSNIITSRQEHVEDRRLELAQQQFMTRQTRENRQQLQRESTLLSEEIASLTLNNQGLLADIQRVKSSTIPESQDKKSTEEIAGLEKELKALEKEKLQLAAQKAKELETGRRVRAFEGQGNRQYLTGLKLGGRRVLILVDASASMLDRKIVNIIRLKIRDEKARRSSAKWQRAVSTVEWLIANLPAHSSIQLYRFDTDVTQLTSKGNSGWSKVTDGAEVNTIIDQLKQTAPIGGTNLEKIFQKARTISPRPDNIILLTDGLPTQGPGGPRSRTITGKGRVKLFERAIKKLPTKIPINTILFPMEGDPLAAVLYWKLAINSGGSFITPTRDWP